MIQVSSQEEILDYGNETTTEEEFSDGWSRAGSSPALSENNRTSPNRRESTAAKISVATQTRRLDALVNPDDKVSGNTLESLRLRIAFLQRREEAHVAKLRKKIAELIEKDHQKTDEMRQFTRHYVEWQKKYNHLLENKYFLSTGNYPDYTHMIPTVADTEGPPSPQNQKGKGPTAVPMNRAQVQSLEWRYRNEREAQETIKAQLGKIIGQKDEEITALNEEIERMAKEVGKKHQKVKGLFGENVTWFEITYGHAIVQEQELLELMEWVTTEKKGVSRESFLAQTIQKIATLMFGLYRHMRKASCLTRDNAGRQRVSALSTRLETHMKKYLTVSPAALIAAGVEGGAAAMRSRSKSLAGALSSPLMQRSQSVHFAEPPPTEDDEDEDEGGGEKGSKGTTAGKKEKDNSPNQPRSLSIFSEDEIDELMDDPQTAFAIEMASDTPSARLELELTELFRKMKDPKITMALSKTVKIPFDDAAGGAERTGKMSMAAAGMAMQFAAHASRQPSMSPGVSARSVDETEEDGSGSGSLAGAGAKRLTAVASTISSASALAKRGTSPATQRSSRATQRGSTAASPQSRLPSVSQPLGPGEAMDVAAAAQAEALTGRESVYSRILSERSNLTSPPSPHGSDDGSISTRLPLKSPISTSDGQTQTSPRTEKPPPPPPLSIQAAEAVNKFADEVTLIANSALQQVKIEEAANPAVFSSLRSGQDGLRPPGDKSRRKSKSPPPSARPGSASHRGPSSPRSGDGGGGTSKGGHNPRRGSAIARENAANATATKAVEYMRHITERLLTDIKELGAKNAQMAKECNHWITKYKAASASSPQRGGNRPGSGNASTKETTPARRSSASGPLGGSYSEVKEFQIPSPITANNNNADAKRQSILKPVSKVSETTMVIPEIFTKPATPVDAPVDPVVSLEYKFGDNARRPSEGAVVQHQRSQSIVTGLETASSSSSKLTQQQQQQQNRKVSFVSLLHTKSETPRDVGAEYTMKQDEEQRDVLHRPLPTLIHEELPTPQVILVPIPKSSTSAAATNQIDMAATSMIGLPGSSSSSSTLSSMAPVSVTRKVSSVAGQAEQALARLSSRKGSQPTTPEVVIAIESTHSAASSNGKMEGAGSRTPPTNDGGGGTMVSARKDSPEFLGMPPPIVVQQATPRVNETTVPSIPEASQDASDAKMTTTETVETAPSAPSVDGSDRSSSVDGDDSGPGLPPIEVPTGAASSSSSAVSFAPGTMSPKSATKITMIAADQPVIYHRDTMLQQTVVPFAVSTKDSLPPRQDKATQWAEHEQTLDRYFTTFRSTSEASMVASRGRSSAFFFPIDDSAEASTQTDPYVFRSLHGSNAHGDQNGEDEEDTRPRIGTQTAPLWAGIVHSEGFINISHVPYSTLAQKTSRALPPMLSAPPVPVYAVLTDANLHLYDKESQPISKIDLFGASIARFSPETSQIQLTGPMLGNDVVLLANTMPEYVWWLQRLTMVLENGHTDLPGSRTARSARGASADKTANAPPPPPTVPPVISNIISVLSHSMLQTVSNPPRMAFPAAPAPTDAPMLDLWSRELRMLIHLWLAVTSAFNKSDLRTGMFIDQVCRLSPAIAEGHHRDLRTASKTPTTPAATKVSAEKMSIGGGPTLGGEVSPATEGGSVSSVGDASEGVPGGTSGGGLAAVQIMGLMRRPIVGPSHKAPPVVTRRSSAPKKLRKMMGYRPDDPIPPVSAKSSSKEGESQKPQQPTSESKPKPVSTESSKGALNLPELSAAVSKVPQPTKQLTALQQDIQHFLSSIPQRQKLPPPEYIDPGHMLHPSQQVTMEKPASPASKHGKSAKETSKTKKQQQEIESEPEPPETTIEEDMAALCGTLMVSSLGSQARIPVPATAPPSSHMPFRPLTPPVPFDPVYQPFSLSSSQRPITPNGLPVCPFSFLPDPYLHQQRVSMYDAYDARHGTPESVDVSASGRIHIRSKTGGSLTPASPYQPATTPPEYKQKAIKKFLDRKFNTKEPVAQTSATSTDTNLAIDTTLPNLMAMMSPSTMEEENSQLGDDDEEGRDYEEENTAA